MKKVVLLGLLLGAILASGLFVLVLAQEAAQPEEVNLLWKGLGILGTGIAFAASALGTGWAQSRIGAAAMGAMAERPELLGSAIIMIAIPETVVILGFVIAIMLKP